MANNKKPIALESGITVRLTSSACDTNKRKNVGSYFFNEEKAAIMVYQVILGWHKKHDIFKHNTQF